MLKGVKRVKIIHHQVFEYGLLSADNKAAHNEKVKEISFDAFKYLKACCLCDESESRFLKLKIFQGMEVLQVQNYAGVVLCPDGTQIEVLPKVAKANDEEASFSDAQDSLLMMLKALKQFRHIQTEVASIRKQKMPLLEVFIAQFLSTVNALVKKGIKSDYVREQDNCHFLKGKLLQSQQLKHNFINRHKFFVEYDAYITDRAENRLIHAALKSVVAYTKVMKSKKLAQELLFAFNEIPVSSDHKKDFDSIKLQRGMQHYEAPLNWTKLILEGHSPQAMKGAHAAYSLLFPMEALFESYVADYLSRRLASGYSLKSQSQSKTLVTHDDQGWFRLKPDIAFSKRDKLVCILDTKWKLLDQAKKNGSDKYGLSQSDFYQMFAYGHKYLGSKGTLVLIYPKQGDDRTGFTKVIEKPFKLDEHLKLYVVPFDLDKSAQNRIDLEFIFNQIEASCNRERLL
ncbi:McrC family protein [Pseudoalteromonas gelatinilytica]|uniref:McrC family protein n=1 Tax=Pseudoalteromonas gelatinilytica TaxID=1703256 RepID=UPI000AC0986B|nr:McrC family protein [Pseudoalteromonas gelatinilytica]